MELAFKRNVAGKYLKKKVFLEIIFKIFASRAPEVLIDMNPFSLSHKTKG